MAERLPVRATALHPLAQVERHIELGRVLNAVCVHQRPGMPHKQPPRLGREAGDG